MNLRPKPFIPLVVREKRWKKVGKYIWNNLPLFILIIVVLSFLGYRINKDYNLCSKNGISMWEQMCTEYKEHNKNMTFCEICTGYWSDCMNETLTKQKYDAECQIAVNETGLNLTGNANIPLMSNLTISPAIAFSIPTLRPSGIVCEGYADGSCDNPRISIDCNGGIDVITLTKGNETSYFNVTEYCEKKW